MEKSFKRKFVGVNTSKCTGCNVCESVCAMEKEWSFNPLRSRIRVVRFHPLFNMAMVCRLCEDPPCVIACPREVLKQSNETGVILINESLCNICGWCIPACPYGAITINPEKRVVMICDLCNGEPKCIDFCPEEALELVSKDEVVPLTSALEKLFSEIKKMLESVKKGEWESLITEADKKMKRLEEKLVKLSEKELKLQSKALS